MNVKIKKLHENAVIPTYVHSGDAGMDLTAVSKAGDAFGNVVYGTGLAFEIPKGYVGLLFPRSSNANKLLSLSNSVGVLDSNYRGEVMFKFKPLVIAVNPALYFWQRYILRLKNLNLHLNVIPHNTDYKIGDRIGQIIIMPYPEIEFQEVDELDETERGAGGYGSTGN